MSLPAVQSTTMQKYCQSSCNNSHCAKKTLTLFCRYQQSGVGFSLIQPSNAILLKSQHSGGDLSPRAYSGASLPLRQQSCVLISGSNALYYQFRKQVKGTIAHVYLEFSSP
jgi:hypothetical protein